MIPEFYIQPEEIKGALVELKADGAEKLKNERAIVHFISTSNLDRVRDILDPKGMDDKEFSQVPSVWYNHNYKWNPNALPIGKSLWRKKQDDGVLSKTQFASQEFADDVYNLHLEDVINSWSVGISQAIDKAGNPVPLRYDEKKNITYWDNWRLLEYSSAPMPANIHAQDVIKNLTDMNFKSVECKNWVKEIDMQFKFDEFKKEYDDRFNQLDGLTKELKTLIEAKDLSDLEKAEKEILEIKKEVETLKTQLTKKSGESLGELKVNDLQAFMKKAIAGELSRITGKQ